MMADLFFTALYLMGAVMMIAGTAVVITVVYKFVDKELK